jgi:hypothetical protein
MMKEVFVFGAGASAESAGTPLGSELVWNYHRDTALLKTIVNGVPDLSKENEQFKNFQAFHELLTRDFPELRDERERWEKRGESFYRPRCLKKNHYIDELLKTLLDKNNDDGARLIRELIFEHITGASLGNPNLLYKNFIAKRLQHGFTSIISFNFDYLLFEDFRNEIYFDYLISFDHIDENRARIYKAKNPIPSIKLNGSLDWGICQHCSRLFLFYKPKRSFYDHQRCVGSRGGRLEPFIIMPHEKYKEKVEVLWRKATIELRQAQKVTIIGYSFPKYDEKMITLFAESLNDNVELEIVDYCEREDKWDITREGIETKYRRMFPKLKKKIKIRLDGFGGYTKDIQSQEMSLE